MFNLEVLTAVAVAPLLLAGMTGIGGKLLNLCGILNTEDEAIGLFPTSVALGFAVYSYIGYLIALLAPGSALVILALVAASVIWGLSYWRLLFKGVSERAKIFLPAFKSPLF